MLIYPPYSFVKIVGVTKYQQISILEFTQVINNVMSCKQVDMFVGEYVTYLHNMFRTSLIWELNGHTQMIVVEYVEILEP